MKHSKQRKQIDPTGLHWLSLRGKEKGSRPRKMAVTFSRTKTPDILMMGQPPVKPITESNATIRRRLEQLIEKAKQTMITRM